MRRLALLGLLLALPFVAVPLVWAATNGDRPAAVCAADERAGRLGVDGGEPANAPVRWDAYAHAVPADRMNHNLRHGGIAVEYGARVPDRIVRQVLAWYRRDRTAVVVAQSPSLGEGIVLSAWSGNSRCTTFDEDAFSEFRDEWRFRGPESPPRDQLRPARAIEQLRATPSRIAFVVSAAAGVSVEVHDTSGRVVRRLGHFTVAGGQRLVLAWDGRLLPPGRYVAVVRSGPKAFRAPLSR